MISKVYMKKGEDNKDKEDIRNKEIDNYKKDNKDIDEFWNK